MLRVVIGLLRFHKPCGQQMHKHERKLRYIFYTNFDLIFFCTDFHCYVLSRMISMKIQQNIATYFDWGAASSLGVVLFGVTLAVFWGFSRLFPLRRLTEVGGS